MPMTLERSVDTEAVVQVLLDHKDSDNVLSYEKIARLSELDLARAKEVLPSARRIVRASSGILFGVVWGVGLQRLRDEAIVKKPEAFKKRVFRGAGRELKDLDLIAEPEKLSKADQHSRTTNRLLLNVIRQQAAVKVEPPKESKMAPQPKADISSLIKGNRG